MKRMVKLKTRFRELVEKKYGGNLPSQDTIARDLEISQTTVSRWMTGAPNRFDSETVANICKNLNCTPGDLLYVVEE